MEKAREVASGKNPKGDGSRQEGLQPVWDKQTQGPHSPVSLTLRLGLWDSWPVVVRTPLPGG